MLRAKRELTSPKERIMSRESSYREKAIAEVSAWIDQDRQGDLHEKFWYVDCARRDEDGTWHIILGEEQLFFSATRLCEPEEESSESVSSESPSRVVGTFDDLELRCQMVLDEVKRAVTRYLDATGQGTVKSWRISVGEETYRILNGERLGAWQEDPRRFLAEYTLIESELRDTTAEQDVSSQP